MGKFFKYFGLAVAAVVALLLVAIVLFALLFDANDFRDRIAAAVESSTGRTLTIDGDLDVSFFPWLAIEMGETQLGNAEGFGATPFMSFERAKLSVRVLPLLLRQQVSVGTAELQSLNLNLTINREGRSNWQDFAEHNATEEESTEQSAAGSASFEIGGIAFSNATVVYNNAQLGERYTLSDANLTTGSVKPGEYVTVNGNFNYRLQPAETTGSIEIDTGMIFKPDEAMFGFQDLEISGVANGVLENGTPASFIFSAPAVELATEQRMASFGELSLSVFDIDINASMQPFSYADSPSFEADIDIAAFSPRTLMETLSIDVPPTADPDTLNSLRMTAKATVSPRNIRLGDLQMQLDETTMTGSLVVPRNERDAYELDINADRIDLARYMEPTGDTAASESGDASVPVEIPAELIRNIKARGNLKLQTATLGNIVFENLEAGINSADQKLRLHPLRAEFFDGAYEGDVRIDASGSVPVLSVNEKINAVSLGELAKAMFERENITGTIDGEFVLSGRGSDMDEIRRNLQGNLSFVLNDGTWHGTDVWYQLRRARALFRREEPPQPELPAKTRFSEVSATGVVNKGILRNDDFVAELPFMRLTGAGTVDLPEATVNYGLSGRVLEKPDLIEALSAEELEDYTRAVIPLKITGPLAQPSIGIDFETLLRDRAREEIRDRLLDGLLGGEEDEAAPEEERDPEDEIKDRLRDLLKR